MGNGTTHLRAAQALGVDYAGLQRRTAEQLASYGNGLPRPEKDAVDLTETGATIGDVVLGYGHGRWRFATVWAVTPTKVSFVFMTQGSADENARWNGGLGHPQCGTQTKAKTYAVTRDPAREAAAAVPAEA